MAILYLANGQVEPSVSCAEEAVGIRVEALGARSTRTAEFEINLARSLAAAWEIAGAESSFRTAMADFDSLDPKSIYNACGYASYGNLCRDSDRLARAETLYAHAQAITDSTDAQGRRVLAAHLVDCGYLRFLQRRHAEAEAMIADGFRLWGDAGSADRELGSMYVLWAAARASAGDVDGALDKLRRAAACGIYDDEAARYRELASLQSRPDYPFKRRSS